MHDDRLVPIGWTSWTSNGDCEMDCTTKVRTESKIRSCRCFLPADFPNSGDAAEIIINSDDVAYFDAYCQPCDGENTKHDECQPTSDCEIGETISPGSDETPTYLHHHCCEDSSAFRVIFDF